MSWFSFLLAGFQMATYGRFWVATEGFRLSRKCLIFNVLCFYEMRVACGRLLRLIEFGGTRILNFTYTETP